PTAKHARLRAIGTTSANLQAISLYALNAQQCFQRLRIDIIPDPLGEADARSEEPKSPEGGIPRTETGIDRRPEESASDHFVTVDGRHVPHQVLCESRQPVYHKYKATERQHQILNRRNKFLGDLKRVGQYRNTQRYTGR